MQDIFTVIDIYRTGIKLHDNSPHASIFFTLLRFLCITDTPAHFFASQSGKLKPIDPQIR